MRVPEDRGTMVAAVATILAAPTSQDQEKSGASIWFWLWFRYDIYITMVLVVSFDSNVLVLPSVLEPGLDLGVAKTKSSCQAAALLDTAVYQDQFLLGPVSIDRYTNDQKIINSDNIGK